MAASTTPRSLPEPAIDAVVFDYDGTLVASRSADEMAVAELIRTHPDAASGAPIFWSHEGEPLVSRIEIAWPGRAGEVLPLFEHQAPPRRFPGITRLLDGLARKGFRLAVVSSRRRAALAQSLKATRLGHHFPVVVGLEDVARPKPSPEGLLLALRRLGVERSRAVFVGDNELDVMAGRRARVTVWRATWGLPILDPAPPHHNGAVLLRHPEEVARHLDELLRR